MQEQLNDDAVRVDGDGLHLPLDLEDALHVEVAGRRVWSLLPVRDGRREGASWVVSWPETLVPHLNGSGEVALRAGDRLVWQGQVSLGDGEGELDPRSPTGRPLYVDKLGNLTAMFADSGQEAKDALVATTADALEFMQQHGHDAFLAFGNLLGALREGKLIGHDNDADISYLAKSTHPVDIILESMRIEREFLEAGWETYRMSGADFKLWITLPDGQRVGIDVFTSFHFAGMLHVMPYVTADLPRERLLPTGTVELEGRTLPAPKEPEPLMEASYGPDWRVPDPSFKHTVSREVRRRISGFMRGERRHVRYWDVFYNTKASRVPAEPSSFARWVAEQEPRPTSLLDIGSGTGRDALWLSEQGIDVLGCDYSRGGVRFASERADERGLSARFRALNLYDIRQMLSAGALLAHERPSDAVYARFLVHALETDGRHNLWRFSRSALRATRGRIYLEFRTKATDHEFGEHYRQFLQPEVVVAELAAYGFVIEHVEDRHGLAVHHHEDPRVCRIIAKLED